MHGLHWRTEGAPSNICVFETLREQPSQSWWRGGAFSGAVEKQSPVPVVGFFRLGIFGFKTFLGNFSCGFFFLTTDFCWLISSRQQKVCSVRLNSPQCGRISLLQQLWQADCAVLCWCSKLAEFICLFLFVKCDLKKKNLKQVPFVWLKVVTDLFQILLLHFRWCV